MADKMIVLTDLENSLYARVAQAKAYIFLFRQYFPSGFDVVAIWMNGAGDCFQYVLAGGGGSSFPSKAEMDLISEPKVLREGRVQESELISILNESDRLGAMEIPHETKSFSSSHVMNLFMIRLPNGRENFFRSKGGEVSPAGAETVIDSIYNLALREFYRRLRSKIGIQPGVETAAEPDLAD